MGKGRPNTQKGFANNRQIHTHAPLLKTCAPVVLAAFLFSMKQIFHENCMNCRFLYARSALRLACDSTRSQVELCFLYKLLLLLLRVL